MLLCSVSSWVFIVEQKSPIDAILGRRFLGKSRGFLAFFVDFEKITRGDPW
eukprot:SAG11_NODE_16324_length_550_cov_3.647450_1_plen_50_part_10